MDLVRESNFKLGLELLDGLLNDAIGHSVLWNSFFLSLRTWHINDLQLWDFNVLGHLVDCLNDDGLLCFKCVDGVLNVCSQHAVSYLASECQASQWFFSASEIAGFEMICLQRTLLNPVLRENLGGLNQFLHSLRNWC